MAADWVPLDARDPAQVQAKIEAWSAKVAPLKGRSTVRILLPRDKGRVQLLLAASQALKAQTPATAVFVAFDPEGGPLWDEDAWGAIQGGVLLPGEMGPNPAAWPGTLERAQGLLPGRPWTLFLPSDPGARLGQIMGDGGKVVLPPGGPGAALAAEVPAGFTEVEGGLGVLLLRNPATQEERRLRFEGGAWSAAAAPKDRHEVRVTAKAAYDVGALLAKVRTERLRQSLAIRTQEADLAIDTHVQARQGPGTDLGSRFHYFQAKGGPEETVQKAILLNGVRANLPSGLQLPVIESRTSMAAPTALIPTDRYRFQDGGPAGEGRHRLTFEPVDGDPELYTGSLLVEEGTGRILEERSTRSGLPGIVLSEDRTLTFGEAAPGHWRLLKVRTFERWMLGASPIQVQRDLVYSGFVINGPGFQVHRDAALASNASILRQTPDGLRYYQKQKDGTRKVEERMTSSTKAIGAVLVVDPTLPLPVTPLAGLAYTDFNAFDKGAQVSALIALIFNQGTLTVPNFGGGFSFDSQAAFGLLPGTMRVAREGHVVSGEAVGVTSGHVNLGLGHDLGAGFRLHATSGFEYDRYSKPLGGKDWTEGFQLPPSGWTTTLTGDLTWSHKGFQLDGSYGEGHRPAGDYGLPGQLQAMEATFTRWSGSAGYDYALENGRWLHGELGRLGGRVFDRFQSLSTGGLGGDVRVAGVRSDAIAASQITYVKGAIVLPTGPRLRMTVSLDEAWVRLPDDPKNYAVTGLGLVGDMPGFWQFTTVRVDLGVGLISNLPGVRSFNGMVALLRVF